MSDQRPPERRASILAGMTLGLLPAGYVAVGIFDLARDGPRSIDHGAAVGLLAGLCALALLGAFSLVPRCRRAASSDPAKKLWFALLPVVLLWAATEFGAASYLRFKFSPQQTYGLDRLASPLYQGYDWAREIIEAGGSAKYDYAPYRLWKARSMRSPLMNIDDEGTRRTLEPPARQGAPEYRVQVYGGSTVFCLEVPDDLTLPSALAKALAARLPDRRVVVENRGVPSYIREQEGIWLDLRLREAPKPDLVIFYDGGNDIVFCGWLEERHRFAAPFGRAMQGDDVTLRGLLGGFFYHYTNLGRLLDVLRLLPRPPKLPVGEAEIQARARRAARRYVAVADQARALASAMGFTTAFILQPSLYGKPTPTRREKVFLDYEYQIRPGLDKLNRAFRDEVIASEAARLAGNFFDLTGLFDGSAGDDYLDAFHVGPRGNEAIAQAIVRSLDSLLPRGPERTTPIP